MFMFGNIRLFFLVALAVIGLSFFAGSPTQAYHGVEGNFNCELSGTKHIEARCTHTAIDGTNLNFCNIFDNVAPYDSSTDTGNHSSCEAWGVLSSISHSPEGASGRNIICGLATHSFETPIYTHGNSWRVVSTSLSVSGTITIAIDYGRSDIECFYDHWLTTLSTPSVTSSVGTVGADTGSGPSVGAAPLFSSLNLGSSVDINSSLDVVAVGDGLNISVAVDLDETQNTALTVNVGSGDFVGAVEALDDSLDSLEGVFNALNLTVPPLSVLLNDVFVTLAVPTDYENGITALINSLSDLDNSFSTLSISTGFNTGTLTVNLSPATTNIELSQFCEGSGGNFFLCSTAFFPDLEEDFFDTADAISATSQAAGSDNAIYDFFADGVSTVQASVNQGFFDRVLSPIVSNAFTFVSSLSFGTTPVASCVNPVVSLSSLHHSFDDLVFGFCPILDDFAVYIRFIFAVCASLTAIYIVFVGHVPTTEV